MVTICLGLQLLEVILCLLIFQLAPFGFFLNHFYFILFLCRIFFMCSLTHHLQLLLLLFIYLFLMCSLTHHLQFDYKLNSLTQKEVLN